MNIDALNSDYYNNSKSAFDRIPCSRLLLPLLLSYKISGKVLEIGSGPGALALWLKEQGCDVTCIEPALEFAKIVASRSLKVFNCTLQEFDENETYDHVVAISSLIHIPKKELPLQIEKIASKLQKGGLFFVTFMKGENEAYEDPTSQGRLRFFAKWKEEELQELLSPYFKLLESHAIDQKNMDRTFFLNVYRC